MHSILKGRRHQELLAEVSRVRVNLYVFDSKSAANVGLLQDEFKVMHRLITDNEIEPIQYASSWFLTLFCGNLHFEYCMRVLECYVVEGDKVLYRVALTIMKYKKRKVKALADFDLVLMYLKDYSEFETISPEEFFQQAFALRLSKSTIESYGKEYLEQRKSSD